MPVTELPIFGEYNVQQFLQVCPEDVANWNLVSNKSAKKGLAFYPAMGRRHVSVLGNNILNFPTEPRQEWKSVDYFYVFENNNIYRYDKNFNRIKINAPDYASSTGIVYFTYLVVPGYTLAVWADGFGLWIHNEATDSTIRVTDPKLVANPTAVIAFGNRIAVAGRKNSQLQISKINLGPLLGPSFLNVDPATCFQDSAGNAIFAYESENIVNFAVLHNTLYVFLESTTSVWSNIPSVFGTTEGVLVTFPWKKNTTYNFDYGLTEPLAMETDFGMMVWMGQNQDGLNQIVMSQGGKPEVISTEAIDILLGRDTINDQFSPYQDIKTIGFLYQWQNVVYFRLSAGKYHGFNILDIETSANSIEYNFKTKQWKRCIESNGERNRIQDHVYFNGRHLVTCQNDGTIYEMSGQFFTNEIRNPDQDNVQANDAYQALPFRYERTTKILSEPDYSEFDTEWVQIDFVWGDRTFINSSAPFDDTIYVTDEDGNYLETEDGALIITEDSGYPQLPESIYRNWFKPSIELFWSDDGGVSFLSADVREFSQLGVYSWRMRWYQLGTSRNRVYKLVCVSPAPIVVLGAIMQIRRASGGAC